ncbi:MAG: tetratricopeptide repeat protein [Verrucomicrobia bacterium]|nr:tetratricopeptide repeat protein [Verrucomicrobiota bacterium]
MRPHLSTPIIHLLTASFCFASFWFVCPSRSQDTVSLPKLSADAKEAAEKGIILFRNDKLEEAKAQFKKMTELAPNHPMGWVNLGSAEYQLGDFGAAERDLRKAIGLDLTAQQAWLTLGMIEYQTGDLDGGLAALSQAVYLQPNDAKAHLFLGVLIRKKGWLNGAEDEMRKAIALDDRYAEAHYNLAVLYFERQPPALELARRHYYRALSLGAEPDPELERALNRPNP